MSEKTEKPTPKKLKDAQKKGQVTKSNEIIIGSQLAIIYIFFLFFSKNILNDLQTLIQITIKSINMPLDIAFDNIAIFFKNKILKLGLIFFGLIFFCTIFSIMIQTGAIFSIESVKPSTKKINPLENIKNIYSLKSLFEFLKNCLKVTILSLIFLYILNKYSNSLQFLPLVSIISGIHVGFILISWLWASLLACYVIFSCADFTFQKYTSMKKLKMTKEEVKQEYKNSEGNPEIKSKRKSLHEEIQSGSLSTNVKNSSFVVKNPTHVAVCLFYKENITPIPVITEKKLDQQALEVIRIAEKNNIPIIEDVKLARALYNDVEIGQVISENFFEPIATILRVINNITYD